MMVSGDRTFNSDFSGVYAREGVGSVINFIIAYEESQ